MQQRQVLIQSYMEHSNTPKEVYSSIEIHPDSDVHYDESWLLLDMSHLKKLVQMEIIFFIDNQCRHHFLVILRHSSRRHILSFIL